MRHLALPFVLPFLTACPTPMEVPDSGLTVEVDAGDQTCRTRGCSVGQWCDTSTGQCASGCDAQEDCTSMETCNTALHQCECAGGFHRCGATCVRNDVVASCGTSCSACPTDPNGTATCSSATCGITCNSNALSCGGACAVCPANAASTQCNGTRCEAGSCGSGRLLCQGQCPACPVGASTTQCSGATCAASACASGRLLCGGQCPQCPAQATSTACNGTTCVATACAAGTVVCGGGCVPCAAGQNFCCKEPVTAPSASGPAHDLALDANGRAVIAFQDNGSVKLARMTASGFSVQTVESGGVGRNVSVTVDSSGVAHLAYTTDQFPYELIYARVPVAGAVTLTTLTSAPFAVGQTDIAYDEPGDRLHVGAYLDGRGWYATKQGSGAWSLRYAMFDGNQMAIALGANAEPQLLATSNAAVGVQASVLSHGAFVTGGLPDGGLFTSSTVNSTIGVSVFHEASLTVDDAGVPWVAFQHPSFRNLRVATLDGGTWVQETVENNGFAESTSIDWFQGAPRVAYIGTSNFVPKYAVKSGSSWSTVIVDSKPITVGTMKLKVDATGRPHLTWWDPDPAVRRLVYVH